MSPEVCERYPCDTAYRRGRHQANTKGGHTLHVCRAGGHPDLGWEVATVALDDGPWRVAVRLQNERRWTAIVDDKTYSGPRRALEAMENTANFAAAIMMAATRAAGT